MIVYKPHDSEKQMSKEERKQLHDLLWKYAKWKYEKYDDFAVRKLSVDELLNEISETIYGARVKSFQGAINKIQDTLQGIDHSMDRDEVKVTVQDCLIQLRELHDGVVDALRSCPEEEEFLENRIQSIIEMEIQLEEVDLSDDQPLEEIIKQLNTITFDGE